jgi:hypothetical protein
VHALIDALLLGTTTVASAQVIQNEHYNFGQKSSAYGDISNQKKVSDENGGT